MTPSPLPTAQQRAPPTSLDGIHDTADEAATKNASKGKFQLPSVLDRRPQLEGESQCWCHARARGRPYADRLRFIDVRSQRVDDVPEELARPDTLPL